MMKIKLMLGVLWFFFVCMVFASGEGTDASSIEKALVTVDSDTPVIVYSLHFYYNYPVEIVIGHSHYETPFKNISELEIYKEANVHNVRVKDIYGDEIEGQLGNKWELVGTTKEDGFEGKFSVFIDSANKIKVIRMDDEEAPRDEKL